MANDISNAPAAPLPSGPNGDYLKLVGGIWVPATLNLADLPAGQGVASTELAAPDFRSTGMPGGFTIGCRFVGATFGGQPGAGTFQAGDFAIGLTGVLNICTVSGTPGTWVEIVPAVAGPTIQRGIISYPANTASLAVALPVAFVDANYSVVASSEENTNGVDMGLIVQAQRNTASSFNVQVNIQPNHTSAWAPPTSGLAVEWIAVHA